MEPHPADLYATRPPWDIGRPQPALQAVADDGLVTGRVLDIGCGTGEHALMAARLGLDVTGVDLAGTALEQARAKARHAGLTVDFRQHDARDLAALGTVFDTVLDCGLFHLFTSADRPALVDSLAAVIRPGGRYFMLGFSDRQPGDWGPHRLTRQEILDAFFSGWRVDAINPATIDVTMDPGVIQAWLSTITRLPNDHR